MCWRYSYIAPLKDQQWTFVDETLQHDGCDGSGVKDGKGRKEGKTAATVSRCYHKSAIYDLRPIRGLEMIPNHSRLPQSLARVWPPRGTYGAEEQETSQSHCDNTCLPYHVAQSRRPPPLNSQLQHLTYTAGSAGGAGTAATRSFLSLRRRCTIS
jgi:hypothetical protein